MVTTAIAWSSSGGTINADGTFSSATPGTFKVVGRGRGWKSTDTSVVIVVPPATDVVRIAVSPETATLNPGATHTFSATGYLGDGSTTTVGVNWTATGGDIDAAGVYTAPASAGTYRVVAANTAGTLADTSTVTVTAPTPPPAPTLAKVYVTPASVSLNAGVNQQFKAYGRNSVGDSVPVTVTFSATGGTVTSGGLYTAGSSGGTFRMVAREPITGEADTAAVTVSAPPPTTATGVPFGPFWLWASNTTVKSGAAAFTVSIQNSDPGGVTTQINAARTMGQKLVLFMTGGTHTIYMTNGKFDLAKWKARMDLFNTAAIKTAVAAAVADGTVLGNALIDEPDGDTWGVAISKATLDQMASYAKTMFPTLPMGVNHTTLYASWRTTEQYHVVDYVWTPPMAWNTLQKGSTIAAWRDKVLAQARLDGVAVAWGLNPLGGGLRDNDNDGVWECPLTTTGGQGSYYPLCEMTAAQVRDWGRTLAQDSGCFLILWAYDAAYMGRTDNQQAFKDLASTLAAAPRKSCRRP